MIPPNKHQYRYIIWLKDGTNLTTEPVRDLKVLLRQAYKLAETQPDADQLKSNIKDVINAIREQEANTDKTTKQIAKEKADRKKSIALYQELARKNLDIDPFEEVVDVSSPDLDAVLSVPRNKGDKPRSKDYAYIKAWRAKKKAQQAAAGIQPKKRGRPRTTA